MSAMNDWPVPVFTHEIETQPSGKTVYGSSGISASAWNDQNDNTNLDADGDGVRSV